MSTNDIAEIASGETRTLPRDIANLSEVPEDVPSSTPLEMSSLATKPEVAPLSETSQSEATHDTPALTTHDVTTQDPSSPPSSDPTQSTAPQLSRLHSTAIGPSSDADLPLPPSKDTANEVAGPALLITLLLTNGARHPFKLDSKYLTKRQVSIADMDPFNLSVYKLKELILREWRDEWEAKPASPSSIRLISFGKLLDDKGVLQDSRFNRETTNVVHMTIKPQDYVEDEDAKGGKGSLANNREGNERSPGCRCVIM